MGGGGGGSSEPPEPPSLRACGGRLSAFLCALCLTVQLQVCLCFHFHLRHFILSLIMLFIACNSFFFFAAKSSRELQTARSFPDPKATVFCCFQPEENGDFICQEVSGTILSSVSAFCFMQFHVGRFEKPPDHVRLVSPSATALFSLKFTSELCFVLETFPSNTYSKYSCIFFGEITKPLYLYLADLIQGCDQIH